MADVTPPPLAKQASANGEELEEEDEELLSLDEVRETFYVALRAQERFSTNLKALTEDLDKRKEGDEWLELVQAEADKAKGFYESQLRSWEAFAAQVDAYVDVVRREADAMAIDELQVEKKEKPEGEGKRRKARTVHPELTKFKLEKQARILGKYGGVPAMGGGLIMGRLPRDLILKATASPAAVEIQYSKVEGKDAQHLAQVMQFKARKSAGGSDGGAAGSGEEPKAAWQAEVLERKGKQYFKEHEKPMEASITTHTVYAGELAEKLKAQQAALAAAEAAAATPKPKDGAAPSIGSATAELADKLKRQQATLKAQEDAAAREAARKAAEAEEAANPSTPSTNWANPAMPFGNELSAALRERQQRQQQGSSGGGATPASSSVAVAPAAADPSPGFSFRAVSSAIAGAGSGTPGASTTPTVRKPPAGAVAITPPGAAGNELAEALRRRREAAAAASGDA